MMSQQAVQQFWSHYFDNQAKLELLDKDIRLCTNRVSYSFFLDGFVGVARFNQLIISTGFFFF